MKGEKQSVRGRRDIPTHGPGSTSGSDDGSLYTITTDERDAMNAKMFLMSQSDDESPSLYEHLSGLITRILDEEPGEALAQFEEISQSMRLERLQFPAQTLRDHVPKSGTETLAKAQWTMFKKTREPIIDELEGEQLDDTVEKFKGVPDIVRQTAFFELAGVGLPREENVRMSLALSDLVELYPNIKSVRFWGKIFGTIRNYYLAETEFGEQDYEDDISVTGDHETDELPSELREEDSSLFDDIMLPDDLKPMYKPPPKIPCEAAGSGLNKKVYYVTPEPGLPWIRLPHVTPAQIHVARKIRKIFTGELDAQVITSPPFPGVERNYLRAQIARISASTHISPLGYYRFDDEGEEEEEHAEEAGSGRDNIIADVEFEGLSIKDLADGSLQAWVHHSSAILPQGRTSWWNPVQTKAEVNEEEEGEEDEEERNEPDEPEPEVGPPLLTPLAEDENVGQSPPWIASASSKFVPEYSIAVLQSNVWLGAFAFGAEKGRYFENIYVGWGLKNLEANFDPALPDTPLPEFPSGPEITESDDPTPEEEAAVRAALQEKQMAAEFEQGIRDEDDDIVDDDGEGGAQFDDE